MRAILKTSGNTINDLFPIVKDVIEIVGFTDKYPDGEIMNSFQAVKMYEAGDTDCFLLSGHVKHDILSKMVRELIALNVKEEDIYVATPDFFSNHAIENIVRWKDYHVLPYFEFHVADHCNLKCKGCIHFSSLVEGEVFTDYENIKKDIDQLHNLVPYFEKIHILGGEPLLNKRLSDYVTMVRDYYPYAEISIVTNGILIRQMSDELIKTIRDCRVRISISLYKPVIKHMNDIVCFLKKNNLDYRYSDPVDQFAYAFNEGGLLQNIKSLNCTCPNLYNGKLYICPIIAYGKYYNNAFGEHIDDSEGSIDIYSEYTTYDLICKKLHEPVEICDKCLYISNETMRYYSWEQSRDTANHYKWEG